MSHRTQSINVDVDGIAKWGKDEYIVFKGSMFGVFVYRTIRSLGTIRISNFDFAIFLLFHFHSHLCALDFLLLLLHLLFIFYCSIRRMYFVTFSFSWQHIRNAIIFNNNMFRLSVRLLLITKENNGDLSQQFM